MDAQELSESLTFPDAAGACHLAEGSCGCADRCCPCTGRPNCSLKIIDSLLSTPGQVLAQDADDLLELRFLLRHRQSAELALAVFCALRRRLEQRHYMEFYRLRRWFECNLNVRTSGSGQSETSFPLQLRFFCVEAVRRDCLCAAISQGAPVGSRLAFAYKASAPASLHASETPARQIIAAL